MRETRSIILTEGLLWPIMYVNRLIGINSIANTIKTMILNINLIHVSSGYYTYCTKVIESSVKSPDITRIGNLWGSSKDKGRKIIANK